VAEHGDGLEVCALDVDLGELAGVLLGLPAHDVPPGFVADVLADGLALAAGEVDVDAALRLAQLVAVGAAGLGRVLDVRVLVDVLVLAAAPEVVRVRGAAVVGAAFDVRRHLPGVRPLLSWRGAGDRLTRCVLALPAHVVPAVGRRASAVDELVDLVGRLRDGRCLLRLRAPQPLVGAEAHLGLGRLAGAALAGVLVGARDRRGLGLGDACARVLVLACVHRLRLGHVDRHVRKVR